MIPLLHDHNAALLLLSYAVATGGIYAALELIERHLITKRTGWLLWGAAACGIGIWSMHFIAVTSSDLFDYASIDVLLTIVSLALSFGAALTSLFMIGLSAAHSWSVIVASSFVLGAGSGIMHFVGMSAVRGVSATYDPVVLGLTVLAGVVDAFLFFALAYRLRQYGARTSVRLLGSLVLGGGMIALHFTGMSAASFHREKVLDSPVTTGLNPFWLGCTVFFITLLILTLSVVGIYIDRRFVASESKYRSLFEANPDVVILVNSEGIIEHGNAVVRKVTGYEPADYAKKRFGTFVVPEDAEPAARLFRTSIGGKVAEGEFGVLRKDGSVVTLRLRAIPRIVEQSVNGVYVIGKDVTEARREMERLAEEYESKQRYQELRFQAVVDSASDAIVVTNGRMNILAWNKGAERMFGYSAAEAKGNNVELIIPPPFAQALREGVRRIRNGGRPTILGKPLEMEGRRKDGTIFPLELTLNGWESGDETYFSAIIRDISERKTVEDALKKSEETYRNLIESFPETVMIGRGTRWLYVNANGVKLLGGSKPEDVTSRDPYQTVHPDFHQNVRRRIQLAEEQQQITDRTEERWVRLDGEPIHVQVSAIPTVFDNQPARIVLVRDMSELQKARDMYERSEKLTVAGELAAGIAHEIRNPLTAIKGFLTLGKESMNPLYYEVVSSELSRIELIISELLMIAKPQKTAFVPCDLKLIMRHVAALLESQANMRNVSLDVLLPVQDVRIRCDENQIKQVLVNMVKNAIEAMESGGTVTLEARLERRASVDVVIRDEGCGIPADKLANLGQPFYTTKDKGTGLGLMVSYNIIRNHHGEVKVDSEAGVGTTFTVTLPLLDPAQSS